MTVPNRSQLHRVLREAVQNQTPDVVVVDEIGSSAEVKAVRSTAQRGIMVVGTAHGQTLSDLLRNPEVGPLVGGTTTVTVGDEKAQDGNKTRTERAGAPAFSSLLEVQARGRCEANAIIA
jgi:stage III sporulation protein SpoIIIAA